LIHKTQPPWEFLLSASRNSLQSYELSRLSHAANLRKEIMQLLDCWLEENSAAMLARLLMQEREHLAAHERSERPAAASVVDERTTAGPGRSKTRNIASDNVFADQAASPPEFRTRS
jgi:hypothetical protein